MKKTKLFKVIPILIVLVVALIIGISFKNSNERNKEVEKNNVVTPSNVKETINKKFISKETTKKTIERTTGEPIANNEVYVGKDSFVSRKPETTFIKKHSLEAYEKLQAKYAPIVERRFLEGTSYTMSKEDDNTVIVTYKPWYFGAYSSDLQYMIESLITKVGVTKDDFYQANDKYRVAEYKARVKSIYILNKYLSNYDNQNEEIKFTLKLKKGQITKNDLYSIYMNFNGSRSKKVLGYYERSVTIKRANKYMEEAANEGILNSNDLLSIDELKENVIINML